MLARRALCRQESGGQGFLRLAAEGGELYVTGLHLSGGASQKPGRPRWKLLERRRLSTGFSAGELTAPVLPGRRKPSYPASSAACSMPSHIPVRILPEVGRLPRDFPALSKGFNPFGELIGLVFTEYGGGRSRCELLVREELFNPHGVLHGGALYAMVDTGMGGALYSLLDEGELCTTVEIKIVYFAAVRSGILICDTRVIERRARLAVMESEIINRDGEEERMAAKALGTFYIYRED